MAPCGNERQERQASTIERKKRKASDEGFRDRSVELAKAEKCNRGSLKERCKGKDSNNPPRDTGHKGTKDGIDSKGPREGGKGKKKAKGKGAIDDIFAGVKRLKEERLVDEAERIAKKIKIKEDHKRRQANPFTGQGEANRRWAWADEVKPVRFDDEGLPIYTWESLRIGQGGGTDLCPFDCDCCF